MVDSDDVPVEIVDRLRAICLALPDAYEEPAWIGTRWRVRGRTFAHVLNVEPGHPAAYARAANADGPITVVTFRSTDEEMDALVGIGPPYFRARWGRDVMGLVFGDDVDWAEVAELMTESYCVLAPKMLVAEVNRPGQPSERPVRQ